VRTEVTTPSAAKRGSPRLLIYGTPENETNRRLLAAWAHLDAPVELVDPRTARAGLRPGDVVLGRLDVRQTLDGVEPGLFELLLLERAGFTVLNRADALLACHDKWRTAQLLERAGLPRPRTTLLLPGGRAALETPAVVKPRFGSWGKDVERCSTTTELELCLVRVAAKPWFLRHGVLLQELLPAAGVDLRIVVAAGEVVGAIERVARSGEWRTNTSLGAVRRPVTPPATAQRLALAAAAAAGADLVGVDLLPLPEGGYVVIELNAAVDFNDAYDIGGRGVFKAALGALCSACPDLLRVVETDVAAA
jgi:RimK family alpha-L-glutamate ligase